MNCVITCAFWTNGKCEMKFRLVSSNSRGLSLARAHVCCIRNCSNAKLLFKCFSHSLRSTPVWVGCFFNYFSCSAKACNYKNLISKQVHPSFVLVFASEQGTGEKRDLQDWRHIDLLIGCNIYLLGRLILIIIIIIIIPKTFF